MSFLFNMLSRLVKTFLLRSKHLLISWLQSPPAVILEKLHWSVLIFYMNFPCGSAGNESACNVGDLCLIPGLRRSPGEGKGYTLQYSGLENSFTLWNKVFVFYSIVGKKKKKLYIFNSLKSKSDWKSFMYFNLHFLCKCKFMLVFSHYFPIFFLL